MPVSLDVYYDEDAKANHFCIKGVPFDDKDRFKSIVDGVKWHGIYKFWHCPRKIWFYNDIKRAYPDVQVCSYVKEWLHEIHHNMEKMFHVKHAPDIQEWVKKWDWAYPHQRVDAYVHLKAGRSFDWSEPGTGKTLKAIIVGHESGIFDRYGEKGYAIVICPNSAKYDWRDAIQDAQERIGKDVPVHVFKGTTKQKGETTRQWQGIGGWLIMNWESLPDLGVWALLGGNRLDYLVVDESHRGNNEKAKQTKELKAISKRAGRILELTATPIVVNPSNLVEGLDRLFPGEFPKWWFLNRYGILEQAEVIIKGKVESHSRIVDGFNVENIDEWHSISGMFHVKRYFKDVITEVPDKLPDKIKSVDLPLEQEKIYNQVAKKWLLERDGIQVPIANVISLVTYLRQILLDPALVGLDMRVTPGKTAALLDMLEDSGDLPYVVMTKFVGYVDRLEEAIAKKGYSYIRFTGKESPEQRQENKRKFQEGGIKIALCGLDAASESITLTRAANMVFMDRDWTKKTNDQAMGRIRRIGQTQAQQYTFITAEGTVEDRIERSNELKAQFEDAFINQSGSMTVEKLHELLLGR